MAESQRIPPEPWSPKDKHADKDLFDSMETDAPGPENSSPCGDAEGTTKTDIPVRTLDQATRDDILTATERIERATKKALDASHSSQLVLRQMQQKFMTLDGLLLRLRQ